MKLRSSLLLILIAATVGFLSAPSRAADNADSDAARLADSLTLQVNSERSSNVFWDTEVIDTHTPILLSWRVASAITGKSRVQIWWRLLDANGKKVLDGSKRYDIENGNYVEGRQLFTPKKRGAYLWVVRATIKMDGPDLEKTEAMPLALINQPQNSYPSVISVGTIASDPLSSDFQRRVGAFPKDSPTALQYPVPGNDVNPAGRRRVITFAKSLSDGAAFSLWDNDGMSPISKSVSPHDSANALAQNAILGIASGAVGYDVSLNPRQAGSISFSAQNDDIQQLVPWDRATAFSAANHFLSGTQFVKELFPDTPAIYTALFRSGNSSLAAIWSNQDSRGRLKLKLSGATLWDAYGNQIDQADKNGDLKIPLTRDLYYLSADNSPEELARVMRAADISGIPSVQAQVLPFTQLPDVNTAKQLQVRLQNITPHAASGIVTVDAPKGWKLEHDAQQFVLQPGEWRVYNFAVTEVKTFYFDLVRVKVRVNNGVTGNWTTRMQPPAATADNWTGKSTFTLDGSLDDWKDASWMQAKNSNFDRKAAVAVRWDNQNLYIAAKVNEPRFTTRQINDGDYRFWESDAIQLGFGWRDEPWMRPSSANFRDTDYGLLLAPFAQNEDGSIEARVLTLWNPTIPFGEIHDRVRWGGAVNGATCRINFNPIKKEATYEAVIPLSALGDLNPQSRVASATTPERPIRFSWVAHTFDGVAVQWSKAAGVFEWWENSTSFLPAERGFLAAQTLLGFSQHKDVEDKKITLPPLPPNTTQEPQQQQQPLPPMNPSPPQYQVPSLPVPVPVQPIPPNLLPPAPPES